jgi:fructoselysine-6-P-deglycase FrlB-like protein
MTKVEQALRSQRDAWREIVGRLSARSGRAFPSEPPRRILLFGIGSSHFAAKLAGITLSRAGMLPRVPVVSTTSMAIGADVMPSHGDWAFGISHRGKTPATLRGLQLCHQAGAFTVLVAGRDTVQEPPDYVRYVLSTCPLEEVEPHTISVSSAICAITTVLLGGKAAEEWQQLSDLPIPGLEALQARAGRGPRLVLGEWIGEWIAREGALKLMEMARLPVRAFSSEEYFHGPRFSESKDTSIWHVSLRDDPRNADIRAVLRIDVSGHAALAWVPALVETQWLALAVALNIGVDPDKPD